MAVLLPLSLFGMNDENEKVVMKIPLNLNKERKSIAIFRRNLLSLIIMA